MTKQYNYHTYKAPNKAKIPKDLNELPMSAAKRLDPTGRLLALMQHVEDNKLFGPINYICPATGRLKGQFEFQSGMCKKFQLPKYLKDGKLEDLEIVDSSHIMQTFLNPNMVFDRSA